MSTSTVSSRPASLTASSTDNVSISRSASSHHALYPVVIFCGIVCLPTAAMLAEPSKALKRDPAGAREFECDRGTGPLASSHAHQDSNRRHNQNSRRSREHGNNLLLTVGIFASFSPLN